LVHGVLMGLLNRLQKICEQTTMTSHVELTSGVFLFRSSALAEKGAQIILDSLDPELLSAAYTCCTDPKNEG
jgi:hypothetical protein